MAAYVNADIVSALCRPGAAAPGAILHFASTRSLIFDSRQRRLDGRRRGATRAGGKSGLRRAGCWL